MQKRFIALPSNKDKRERMGNRIEKGIKQIKEKKDRICKQKFGIEISGD